MKKHLIVAFLAFAGAGGCGDNPPPPRDDASADARAIDAGVDARAVDASVPVDRPDAAADTPGPDSGTADAADRVDAAPADGSAVDGGAADGPDAAPGTDGMPDAEASDAAPGIDAGATCGAGVSREMLCTSYCDGMGRFCTGGNAQYSGDGQCRAACNAPTLACGNPGDITGDSLFCRVAHMTLAGVGGAATECRNAGPTSPTCR
jgi:hypothetical protein